MTLNFDVKDLPHSPPKSDIKIKGHQWEGGGGGGGGGPQQWWSEEVSQQEQFRFQELVKVLM